MAGTPLRAIVREMGVSSATVSYHRGKIGLPKRAGGRGSKKYDWSIIQADRDAGVTIKELREKYGMAKESLAKAIRRGDLRRWRAECHLSLDELVVRYAGKRITSNGRKCFRRALILAGWADQCAHCKANEWYGHKLSLEIHHLDGNPANNTLDNLELRCPNCHSITENWRGRNTQRAKLRLGVIG